MRENRRVFYDTQENGKLSYILHDFMLAFSVEKRERKERERDKIDSQTRGKPVQVIEYKVMKRKREKFST